MQRIWSYVGIFLLLLVVSCKPTTEDSTDEQSDENSTQQTNRPSTPEAPAVPPEGTFEGVRNGVFESTRFNIRFQWPANWNVLTSDNDDAVSIEGPDGIQMIIANSQSFQLVDANFQQLNDRVSFDNVNILPDRTEQRPINGLPAYRVEGDALLRGENVPIYFISQVMTLPGEPVAFTVYIPGENYFENSDEMRAVLDSIEALNLRPQ